MSLLQGYVACLPLASAEFEKKSKAKLEIFLLLNYYRNIIKDGSFIAKQLIGNQLDSVKGALGDKKDEGEGVLGGRKEIDPEVEAALREAEEKREAKHRKMEEEREVMRQGIRDKYGIKKKEEELPNDFDFSSPEGRLGRKRKTPAELAAEANEAEDENILTSMLPENMRNMANKVTEVPGKLMSEASEKCLLM
ncbi:unnamed protein product [Heterobilharzia americana]|nr:unnamed protein product [Heterobilharzia americana]